MAGGIISLWAQKGAKLVDCGRMCGVCAFRKGTEANNDDITIQAAEILAYENGVFYCHELPPGVLIDLSKKCIGFLYAKEYLNSLK